MSLVYRDSEQLPDADGQGYLTAGVRSKGYKDFRGLGWTVVMGV